MSNQEADDTHPATKEASLELREIKCVDDLCLQAKFADVWFSFDNADDGTVTRIPAHKLLLAVVSDVFEAMFFGELKEAGDIKIADASVGEFKEFLQFFYRSDAKLTTDHVAGVMNLGQKYNVEPCIDACVEYLEENLTDENVCATLSLAILYDQNELTTICAERIQSNTVAVFQSAEFLECSKDALAHILQLNPLSCSEVDVFEACMSWVKAKSQQNTVSKAMVQEYLGDLYFEIRFASMTVQEFCALDMKYGDVLRDDFHDIIHLIAQTERVPGRFNTSLRQMEVSEKFTWNADEILECDRDCWTQQKFKLDAEEKTIFSSSDSLLLGSFFCNDICYGKSDPDSQDSTPDLSVDVKIFEARTLDDSDAKILSNTTAQFSLQSTSVSLPQPILIRPNHFYTISMNGFPEDYYFFSNEQDHSVTVGPDIKIEFHTDKIFNGKIGGLIWQLNFNKIEERGI